MTEEERCVGLAARHAGVGDEAGPRVTCPWPARQPRVELASVQEGPLFADPRSRALGAEIARVAPSEANVLVTGETGTGKEVVARHVHRLSTRRAKPFVAVNCAALSDTLIESELFGHERGAFTGAVASNRGWFEAADGGTLFLDEIGELSPALQAKLLRVIQEREVVRIGARQPRPLDVRLITATNVDLQGAVREGRFREDLFYRIKVASLHIPPLRDRPGDILPLAERACRRASTGRPVALAADAEQALLAHVWPGNVRELENVVQSALIGFDGALLHAADLRLTPPSGDPSAQRQRPRALDQAIDQLLAHSEAGLYDLVVRTLVERAFEFAERNQVRAAASLGITRNVLRTQLARYGMLASARGQRRHLPE
jgi:sigma-54 dependent transcriptional regulator